MKNYTFILLFSYSLLFSQALPPAPTNFGNLDQIAEGRNPGLDFVFQQYRNQEKGSPSKQIVGTPFLDESFKISKIYSQDGLEAEVLARYDGYNDEVQLKQYENQADAQLKVLVKNEGIYCVLDNIPIRYRTFENKKGNEFNGYLFEIFSSKNYILYIRNIVEFKEGKEAISSFELPVASKFILRNELYIQQNDKGEINYFKPIKKEVLGLFEGKIKDEVKRFIEDNGLKIKEVEDVTRIFRFVQSL